MGGSWARTGMPNPTTSTAVYNAANELTNWNGATLTFDANGNMTSDGTNTYTWDTRNHLAAISGNFTAGFEYDPFGRRLGKTINSTTTDFLYDGVNPVQELSGNTVTANLLTGLGVDEYFTRTGATGTSDFLFDALGSTLAVADPTGTVQAQYTYTPFGGTTTQGGSNSSSFQFTGRENDLEDLYYLRARFYSPALHRFLSQDPAWSATGGINLYAYVGDSAPNFKDPLGMLAIDPTFPVSCLPALRRAIELVRRAAQSNPKCNCQFREFGQGRSLLKLLNAPDITIHYNPVQSSPSAYEGPGELAAYTNPGDTHDIWFEPYACNMGRWTMASFLVHELTHIALTPGLGQEGTAGLAQIACGFPIQQPSTITVRP